MQHALQHNVRQQVLTLCCGETCARQQCTRVVVPVLECALHDERTRRRRRGLCTRTREPRNKHAKRRQLDDRVAPLHELVALVARSAALVQRLQREQHGSLTHARVAARVVNQTRCGQVQCADT